ncbi:MAG: hypothetical protein LBL81_04020 [Tannerella sp.]|jgi:hypothetical protein|nr:hypothetical protein [Tannerella sp.]
METKEQTQEKSTRQTGCPNVESKPLSPIAKYWQTVEKNSGRIIDMKAVLK